MQISKTANMHFLTAAIIFSLFTLEVYSMPTPAANLRVKDLVSQRINGIWSKQGKDYDSDGDGELEFAEDNGTAVLDSMLAKYKASVSERLDNAGPNSTCTRDTVVVRKEWSVLSPNLIPPPSHSQPSSGPP